MIPFVVTNESLHHQYHCDAKSEVEAIGTILRQVRDDSIRILGRSALDWWNTARANNKLTCSIVPHSDRKQCPSCGELDVSHARSSQDLSCRNGHVWSSDDEPNTFPQKHI